MAVAQQDQEGIIVGVAPDKYLTGLNNLGDKALLMLRMPLASALTKAWESDAHFFPYFTVGGNTRDYPRINKPLLGKLRAVGVDVATRAMCFDIDNPGHVPWHQFMPVDDWMSWFHSTFVPACPWAGQYHALYTSRNGARLIFALSSPISVDDAEDKHRWMARDLLQKGLANVDLNCSDWTRCFRLPYVIRDGERTHTNASMRFFANWNNFIDPNTIPATSRVEALQYTHNIRDFNDPVPDRVYAERLREEWDDSTGKTKTAKWLKAAKRRLAGRDCYDCLFNDAILAAEGQRDSTLHKYVGQAVAMLFGENGISPSHIYALFLPVVDTLRPDAQTPDWSVKLWDHIGRIWVREEAKEKHLEGEKANEAERIQATADSVIAGMQTWCKHPQLHYSNVSAQAFACRNLIVAIAGSTFHIMKPDGMYDEVPAHNSTLIARIRTLGMDGMIETTKVTFDGKVTDANTNTILNKNAVIVKEVIAKPCIKGGFIDGLGTPNARLVIPTYRRRDDIEPQFNADVDTWLRKFFGEGYDRMEEWLKWCLAFEEGPICAVSIKGFPGVGKKLLVQGLAECLEVPEVAEASDMIGSYSYGLMTSPFLVVDEGWPKGMGMHPAEAFRSYTTGKPFYVNRKFMAPVKVYNPCRIIFTANNADVVGMLAEGRDLTPDDQRGLADRLRHFKALPDAAEWLRHMGGFAFTARPGRRWIAQDSGGGMEAGGGSNFIVAKHLMYLYTQRGTKAPGIRMLVDGDVGGDLMTELRTATGSTPLVMEAILRMLEHPNPHWQLPIQDCTVMASTSLVLDFFRDHMAQQAGQRLTDKRVISAFRNICMAEPESPSDVGGIRARWWRLNPELLLEEAERQGRKCVKLSKLVADFRSTRQYRDISRAANQGYGYGYAQQQGLLYTPPLSSPSLPPAPPMPGYL